MNKALKISLFVLLIAGIVSVLIFLNSSNHNTENGYVTVIIKNIDNEVVDKSRFKFDEGDTAFDILNDNYDLNYKDDVPSEVKQERVDRLMELQAQISEEINAQKVGQMFKVIIDREEEDFYVGRTEYDSPDVDGEVLIVKNKQLTIGDFYQVRITESDMYDLYGEVL